VGTPATFLWERLPAIRYKVCGAGATSKWAKQAQERRKQKQADRQAQLDASELKRVRDCEHEHGYLMAGRVSAHQQQCWTEELVKMHANGRKPVGRGSMGVVMIRVGADV